MNKKFLITLLALAITFGLFGFMQFLIQNQQQGQQVDNGLPTIVITHQAEDSKENDIVRNLPKPPPVPKAPEMKPLEIEPAALSKGLVIETPQVVTTGLKTGFNEGGINKSHDSRPILRVEPRYPIVAARDGLEGWVELLFDIDKLGRVFNVRVLASEPRQVFDKEAKKALKKWKYKAKMVDGVATEQHNLSVLLDFKLSK